LSKEKIKKLANLRVI